MSARPTGRGAPMGSCLGCSVLVLGRTDGKDRAGSIYVNTPRAFTLCASCEASATWVLEFPDPLQGGVRRVVVFAPVQESLSTTTGEQKALGS